MGGKTAIEWADATWNPVTGCTKVSPGCKFCYAERITERWGQKFTEIKLHPDRLDKPFHWRKPRRIFVNSMSDLFHESIPTDFIIAMFGVMMCARAHTFQVLTKRHDRMREFIGGWGYGEEAYMRLNLAFANSNLRDDMERPGNIAGCLLPDRIEWPLPNVWLGVSVENQEQADKRIPVLLETPAAVRFLSVEPLLELVDLTTYVKALNWVIVGGESGGPYERGLVHRNSEQVRYERRVYWYEPKGYPLNWVRSIRDQCVAAGVPFFFKQWGGPTPKSGGRMLDGRTWDEYPKT